MIELMVEMIIGIAYESFPLEMLTGVPRKRRSAYHGRIKLGIQVHCRVVPKTDNHSMVVVQSASVIIRFLQDSRG
jgi:hypothetical protein